MALEVLISIAIVLIALAVLAFFVLRKSGCGVDYYSMFIIGLVWLPVGLILKIPALWILGGILFIVGLVNKKAWRKRCMWVNMRTGDKWARIIILLALIIILAAGLYILFSQGII